MEGQCSSGCWWRREGSWSSTALTGSSPEHDSELSMNGLHPGPPSPARGDFLARVLEILDPMDPLDRLRSVGKRMTDPVEPLAQRVAERAIDLLVNALDVNALVARINLNAVLDRVDLNKVLAKVDINKVLAKVDINELLAKVDVDALLDRADFDEVLRRLDVGAVLDRVDVNELVQRIDMDVLVEETDLGAVIARSSGGVASEALDAARSQAVGLGQFIDRWVQRALRRTHPGPGAPGGRAGREPPVPPDGPAPALSQPGQDQS